jgi:hypothetical protein
MRNGWLMCALLVVVSALAHAQGDGKHTEVPAQYLGVWSGSWAGGGDTATGGDFEMTIERGKDGAPAGKVNVGGGESGHSAVFKSLSFGDNKMNAKYDYPLGEGGEIVMEATFDGKKGTGTWLLHPQNQDSTVLARGTWTVTKK